MHFWLLPEFGFNFEERKPTLFSFPRRNVCGFRVVNSFVDAPFIWKASKEEEGERQKVVKAASFEWKLYMFYLSWEKRNVCEKIPNY